MTDPACRGWDNGDCEGTPHCPPRCPRFFDDEGRPILIRRLRESDCDSLSDLYASLDAGSRTMGVPPPTAERRGAWVADLLSAGWHLVACHGDLVVGHVAVVPESPGDASAVGEGDGRGVDAAGTGEGDGRGGGELPPEIAVPDAVDPEPEFLVFLRREYRGCGIGSELLDQLVAYAGSAGHDGLRLAVSTHNERAITVFENLGFEAAETTPAMYRMSLALTDGRLERARRPPADRGPRDRS